MTPVLLDTNAFAMVLTGDERLPAILTRLDFDEEHWFYGTQNFESSFKTLVGALRSLCNVCVEIG